jgi:hypothetical protein
MYSYASGAYLLSSAFKEDVLKEMSKGASGFALASLISKGSKFSGLDVKRVYFGLVSFCLHIQAILTHSRNWLRDYSQVRFDDIASPPP